MNLDKLVEKNRKAFYKSINYIPNKSITYNVLPSLMYKNNLNQDCLPIHKESILASLTTRLISNTPFKEVEIGGIEWEMRDLLIYFDNNS